MCFKPDVLIIATQLLRRNAISSVFLVLLLLVIGTFVMHVVEGWDTVNAFYWACVTITTGTTYLGVFHFNLITCSWIWGYCSGDQSWKELYNSILRWYIEVYVFITFVSWLRPYDDSLDGAGEGTSIDIYIYSSH